MILASASPGLNSSSGVTVAPAQFTYTTLWIRESNVKHYYDLEFLEDGITIELISVGIVAEDGREYYAVNLDAPWHKVCEDQWLLDNVVPSLPLRAVRDRYSHPIDVHHPDVKPKSQIADEVKAFLLSNGTPPELWAYYAAYDHVGLCQLWGRMIDLPDGIPMWTNDFKQEIERLGIAHLVVVESDAEHNALADARGLRDAARRVTDLEF